MCLFLAKKLREEDFAKYDQTGCTLYVCTFAVRTRIKPNTQHLPGMHLEQAGRYYKPLAGTLKIKSFRALRVFLAATLSVNFLSSEVFLIENFFMGRFASECTRSFQLV